MRARCLTCSYWAFGLSVGDTMVEASVPPPHPLGSKGGEGEGPSQRKAAIDVMVIRSI